MHKKFFSCRAPAVPMAAVHALDKHCRVCGGRLQRAKGKRPGRARACVDHRQPLLQTFGIDIAEDCVDIHPTHFCNGCYAATRWQATAASKASAYHHSISLFPWSRHTEKECEVFTHEIQLHYYAQFINTAIIFNLQRYVSTLQLLPLGERRTRRLGGTVVAALTKVLQL